MQSLRLGVRALVCLLAEVVCAQSTSLVSRTPGGQSGNNGSAEASISEDGRFVAFISWASDLVRGDTNGHMDVFVRDRQTGSTELVSVNSSGVQGNGDSLGSSISADGRFVVFSSFSTNFAPQDTNGSEPDIFLRDRLQGTTELVSLSWVGTQGYGNESPSVSADGNLVEFTSYARLTLDAPVGLPTIYVRNRSAGTTECISRVVGAPGPLDPYNGASGFISDDGRYVVFQTYVDNIVVGDTNHRPDVFLRDRQTGAVEWLTHGPGDKQVGYLGVSRPISADDRFVVFNSAIGTFVPGDTNRFLDVFVRDRWTGTVERVSTDNDGTQGNENSYSGSISADGRYVVFQTNATNLLPPDTNFGPDILVHDRVTGITERACVNTAGAQANRASYEPAISGDGRYVVFNSDASNLDYPADHDNETDVYERDRFGETRFESLCDAGFQGVLSCPCANPPARRGRGCDNSSGTGGAILTAHGAARLSADSLVLTSQDERLTATSLVLQGTSSIANGSVYGQGIRCVGGHLVRLYSRTAVEGTVSVPEVGTGDATISARSAASGDPIQAGQSRWYLVLYRDPVVLGACSSTSTFNATQTGKVDWEP